MFSAHKNLSRFAAAAALIATLATPLAQAQPTVLTPGQWRADLQQLDEAIRETHPRPFVRSEENVYLDLVAALDGDIDDLSDKEIIIRLAEVVAAIKDGHTRLTIPRQHPEIGLEFGHSGTPLPNHAGLAFKQLPIAFEKFSDGVFVTHASPAMSSFIGYQLAAIESTPAINALSIVQRITFAENNQLMNLMGADRLSLPEALAAFGMVSDESNVMMTLVSPEGEEHELAIEPLPEGEIEWVDAFSSEVAPIRLQNPDKKFWSRYLRKEKLVYAQINEIADAEIPLAKFATDIVAQAERHNAKLVIDLRQNFGGSGDLNRTLELALIQSRELNQYGRVFVFTGRRTFSAAQMLVNMLEKYTRAVFTGEPTGARPDHYGDARKTRLENSGLTLRVSTLHWSSLLGNDSRAATNPDLPAPWTSAAYFSGGDPSLEQIIVFEGGDLKPLLRGALERDDHYQISRYLTISRLFPDTFEFDFSRTLLDLGREFAETGASEQASYAFRYGLFFYPDNKELQAALDALQNLESGE